MTAPESHDNHVVEEEQRIIDQALDALIDIHRAEAAGDTPSIMAWTFFAATPS